MKRVYQFQKIIGQPGARFLSVDPNGRIDRISREAAPEWEGTVIDHQDRIAMPGFIDCHMHGALNFDVATCSASQFLQLAKGLYVHGETAFMPTIPAAHPEQNQRALAGIAQAMRETAAGEGMARVIGCHMEGPFLCEKYKGALDETAFCDCTPAHWKALIGEWAHVVRRITVDPLCPGVMEMIPFFTEQGIQVSLGHTAADAETVDRAFERGATSVTHLYNAMSGLHHRQPGTVGAALASDSAFCEIITDFLHVAPHAVKAAVKAKTPEKIAVITDSCQAAGMPDGEYVLGGRRILVVNGEARMPEGQLASSTVFMDRELKNLLSLGFSPEECSLMLSRNPARLSGVESDMGAFAEGKLFAAVLTDESGTVYSVIS